MITCHGVLLCVYNKGVFIIGNSGIGKSELGLELISRGHKLIADDAPEFYKYKNTIMGKCPVILKNFLYIDNIGIINIKQHFGKKRVKSTQKVDLVIELFENSLQNKNPLQLLKYEYNLLDCKLPLVKIHMQPGRNLALLVETAVKDLILQKKGYESLKAFITRHNYFLRSSENETCHY